MIYKYQDFERGVKILRCKKQSFEIQNSREWNVRIKIFGCEGQNLWRILRKLKYECHGVEEQFHDHRRVKSMFSDMKIKYLEVQK